MSLLNAEAAPIAKSFYDKAANFFTIKENDFDVVKKVKSVGLPVSKGLAVLIGLVEVVVRKVFELIKKGIDAALTKEQQQTIKAKFHQVIESAKTGVTNLYYEQIAPLFAKSA